MGREVEVLGGARVVGFWSSGRRSWEKNARRAVVLSSLSLPGLFLQREYLACLCGLGEAIEGVFLIMRDMIWWESRYQGGKPKTD